MFIKTLKGNTFYIISKIRFFHSESVLDSTCSLLHHLVLNVSKASATLSWQASKSTKEANLYFGPFPKRDRIHLSEIMSKMPVITWPAGA